MSITYPTPPAAALDFEVRVPPLPRTVTEVSDLMMEATDEPDVASLTEAIERDAVVAAAVLRRINSAFFGLRRRVGDVPLAVRLLGFHEVCNLALTQGLLRLRDVLETAEQEQVFFEILRHGVATGYYAQELTALLRLPLVQNAYTLGLLHGIGRLVLIYNCPGPYVPLWRVDDATLEAPSVHVERRALGVDHAATGRLATETWLLPETMCQAIGLHTRDGLDADLPRELRQTVGVLALASTAAHGLCFHEDAGAAPDLRARALSLADEVAADADEIIDWFGVVHHQVLDYVEASSSAT